MSHALASALPGLRHGFTFGLARMGDAEVAEEVRARTGMPVPLPWVFNQPHGPDIFKVESTATGVGAPPEIPVVGYDGGRGELIFSGQSILGPSFVVKSADCVAILAVHPARRAYAALHAGWRGVALGILPRLLSTWQTEFGSLEGLSIALGPHIRSCCFEVKEDCLAQFRSSEVGTALETRDGRMYLGLEQVLRNQARTFGIRADKIDTFSQCTRCYQEGGEYRFASYRRAQQEGRSAGRNLGYIGPAM